MKLPVQETPSYNTTLPLSQQKIKFRPFLVKEQKNLMMAREGKNSEEIFNAICEIVKTVTFEKVDAMKLPMADLEYLFLQIRCKSIGETTKLNIPCKQDGCDGFATVELDLENVSLNLENISDTKIQISDELMIELDWPTAKSAIKLESFEKETDAIKPMLRMCMVRIFDSQEIYELKEFPDSEIDNFIESLTLDQFEKIMQFFNGIPTLEEKVNYQCPKCKTKDSMVLKGLNNFF